MKSRCCRSVLLLFALLAFGLLTSCAHQGDWAKRVDWEELDITRLPGPEDYPDAGAVVLLDEGEMEILSGSELKLSIFERHRVVKILDVRGFAYANVVIAYDPRSSVEGIRARTISPDGKITVVEDDDIYDVTLYPDYIWYSDQRAKIFTFPSVEVGSILEYSYRMNIRSLTFWHSWVFQDFAPTLLSRFTLIGPSEWDVNYRVYRLDIEPRVTKAPKGFKSTYVWEARDVPALKAEFGMPPKSETAARLAIAPAGVSSWQDVARWYHGLAASQMKANEAIKALARRLTDGASSDLEKLKRIYEWVRDEVRYVAVEIGIGGYQPHHCREVLKNRYGDCKDMATLLCSLAREAGIEAYQAIVSTLQNGRPDTTLPSQLQFNHVIVYCPSVGNEGTWMDATEKGCPFGQLPWYDQGLPALVVDEKGDGRFVTTPTRPSDSNRVSLDWKVYLKPSGGAVVKGTMRVSGAQASELREELYYTSGNARRLWLETHLASRCSGAILDSFSIRGLRPVGEPLTVSYVFHTNTFAVPTGEWLSFKPGAISGFDLPDYFRSPKRTHPVRLRFGSRTDLLIQLYLPLGWEVRSADWSDSLQSRFGTASWRWRADGSKFTAQAVYRIHGGDVEPEAYGEFQRLLEGIRERNLRDAVFVPAGTSVTLGKASGDK